jgi:hypothetical protein
VLTIEKADGFWPRSVEWLSEAVSQTAPKDLGVVLADHDERVGRRLPMF